MSFWPMIIKARLYVTEVTKTEYGTEQVKARAAHGEGSESFSKATPDARLELTISNEGAHGFFVPGKDYDLEFKARE